MPNNFWLRVLAKFRHRAILATFGGYFWLFSPKRLVFKFKDIPFRTVQVVGKKMAYAVFLAHRLYWYNFHKEECDYSTREHTTFSLIIVFGLEIMRKGSRCTSCSAKIPCQSGKLYRNTLYLWVHIKYCSSFADVRARRKKGKRVLIEDEVQRQH